MMFIINIYNKMKILLYKFIKIKKKNIFYLL